MCIQSPKAWIRSHITWVAGRCNLSCRCWHLNSGPLKKKRVFLVTDLCPGSCFSLFKINLACSLMHFFNTSGQCHHLFSPISLPLPLFFTVLFLMFLSICFGTWPTEFNQGHRVTTGWEVFIAAWFAEQWVNDWRQWYPRIHQSINSQMISCNG